MGAEPRRSSGRGVRWVGATGNGVAGRRHCVAIHGGVGGRRRTPDFCKLSYTIFIGPMHGEQWHELCIIYRMVWNTKHKRSRFCVLVRETSEMTSGSRNNKSTFVILLGISERYGEGRRFHRENEVGTTGNHTLSNTGLV